jgi:hypothetical protein
MAPRLESRGVSADALPLVLEFDDELVALYGT